MGKTINNSANGGTEGLTFTEIIEREKANERKELYSRQVSSWLKFGSDCGETAYPDIKTNEGWCDAEVRRLADKGVRATFVVIDGWCAVFRMEADETREGLIDRIRKCGMSIGDATECGEVANVRD